MMEGVGEKVFLRERERAKEREIDACETETDCSI